MAYLPYVWLYGCKNMPSTVSMCGDAINIMLYTTITENGNREHEENIEDRGTL